MFYRPYCQCSKAVSYISLSIFITKLTVLRVEVPQVPQIPYNDHDHNGDGANDDEDDDLPEFHEKIQVHKSVVATFYAPSDLSGVGRMQHELIRAVPSWQDGPSRYDCVFAVTDESVKGMRGLDVARVWFFLLFSYCG